MQKKELNLNLEKIRNQKFRANYKSYGYDAKQVDEFLDLTLEINTFLKTENEQLNKRLTELQNKYNQLLLFAKQLESQLKESKENSSVPNIPDQYAPVNS